VTAWGVWALAAAADRPGKGGGTVRGDGLAVLGGLLLGGALLLSYGLALAGLLAVTPVLARRRLRPLVVGGAAVLAVLAVLAAHGFWWPEGLDLAAERVRAGPAWQDRPWAYFAVANLAAVAVAVGPATAGALATLGRRLTRTLTLMPAAALAAIAVAISSGLSKGEAERIYLPFSLWLVTATAALPGRHRRGWLVAQVVLALAVQLCWRLKW
jgi:hypothetical protein